MSHFYIEALKKKINEKQTVESLHEFIENTDFFFKILKVKLESQDPEMLNQAIDELKQLQEFLKSNPKN